MESQEQTSQAEGILPVETITQTIYRGWWLPGQGSPYDTCGHFKQYEICDKTDDHPDGLAQVKKVHNTCYRISCPVCYEKAITRAADRIVNRLTSYLEENPEAGELIHVQTSPPQAKNQDYRTVRRKAARMATKSGMRASAMIYHPFRQNKRTKTWRFAPHFHLIGYGWVQNTGEIYRKHGWIVKNIGVRKDAFKVVRYQLSHCGVNDSYHSITYQGELSGRKFKAPPMPRKTSTCIVCGAYMQPAKPDGFDFLRDLPEGTYSDPVQNWIVVKHSRPRGAEAE